MERAVTAIVVNWNGAAHLPDCLGSLAAQTYGQLDVLVVDNGSTDESSSIVERCGMQWLSLGENTGLAPAFNRGAKEASGELFLFLNNDMRFSPDFVERMVECWEQNTGCGAVDAVQLNWEGNRVEHAGTLLVRSGLKRPLPGWDLRPVQDPEETPTLFASGANTLISAAVFNRIGGWDDRFIAGWEDVDLGWRLWLAGLPVVIASKAICFHKVGASSTSTAGTLVRNEAAVHAPLLFAIKHAPPELVVAALGRFVVAAAVAGIGVDVPKLRLLLRVLGRLRRQLPAAYQWRRSTHSAALVTPRLHWKQMQTIGRR